MPENQPQDNQGHVYRWWVRICQCQTAQRGSFNHCPPAYLMTQRFHSWVNTQQTQVPVTTETGTVLPRAVLFVIAPA